MQKKGKGQADENEQDGRIDQTRYWRVEEKERKYV